MVICLIYFVCFYHMTINNVKVSTCISENHNWTKLAIHDGGNCTALLMLHRLPDNYPWTTTPVRMPPDIHPRSYATRQWQQNIYPRQKS